MWFPAFCSMVLLVGCAAKTQDLLIEIFGTPPPATANSTSYEDVTVQPTLSPTVYTDAASGDSCTCLPYYLCDAGLNDIHSRNASITGFDSLDIRFGEERQCQESVEVCCKHVKVNPEGQTEPPAVKPKGCGFKNPGGLDFNLVGGIGTEAGFGEFPWVVALLDAFSNKYVGVGALIHPSVVITGAHIANTYGSGGLKVRAGEWDTQTLKERLPHQERGVQEIVIHEYFHQKSLKNDIGLLLLESPVELDAHINVLCMPDEEENFDLSRQCIVNGWGKNVFGAPGKFAVIQKRVELGLLPQEQCSTLLRRTRLGNHFSLHESFICAGGEEGKDVCTGDGGAPLACPVGNNRYKLVGLTAWGIGCGQKNVPGVYANVPMFRRWVDDKMAAWGLGTRDYLVN